MNLKLCRQRVQWIRWIGLKKLLASSLLCWAPSPLNGLVMSVPHCIVYIPEIDLYEIIFCLQRLLLSPKGSSHHRTASESSSFSSSTELEHSISEDCMLEKNSGSGYFEHSARATQHHRTSMMKPDKPIDLLRKVAGNGNCADCGASEPDWASLNLGVLLCIECSGVHRNMGVHISKVNEQYCLQFE